MSAKPFLPPRSELAQGPQPIVRVRPNLRLRSSRQQCPVDPALGIASCEEAGQETAHEGVAGAGDVDRLLGLCRPRGSETGMEVQQLAAADATLEATNAALAGRLRRAVSASPLNRTSSSLGKNASTCSSTFDHRVRLSSRSNSYGSSDTKAGVSRGTCMCSRRETCRQLVLAVDRHRRQVKRTRRHVRVGNVGERGRYLFVRRAIQMMNHAPHARFVKQPCASARAAQMPYSGKIDSSLGECLKGCAGIVVAGTEH